MSVMFALNVLLRTEVIALSTILIFLQNYGNYEFGFNIEGLSWDQFQRESGDALGRKTGAYGFRGADGRLRLVEYVADELGFRAKVQTNEPGTKPSKATATAGKSYPSAVVEETTKRAIVSPPPARLLRRLSPPPPQAALEHRAQVQRDLEPKVAPVAAPKAATQESALKLPVKSIAANFESPLLPIGAVKMDSYAALRRYSPNIFHLGRPVDLVHGVLLNQQQQQQQHQQQHHQQQQHHHQHHHQQRLPFDELPGMSVKTEPGLYSTGGLLYSSCAFDPLHHALQPVAHQS